MLGRGNTGAALGSGAVDADFWALVCEDEEWLTAEFNEVVSEAWEAPTRPSRRPAVTDPAPEGRAGSGRWGPGATRPWRTGTRPGRFWRRERGPPYPGDEPASAST